MTPVIFAFDPGLAYMGLVVVDVKKRRLIDADIFISKKANSTRQVFASSDTMNRAMQCYAFVKAHLKASQARGERVVLVAHESISMPRNASTANKIGLSFGVIAAFSSEHDLPLFEVSPKQVKQGFSVTGLNDKDDVGRGVARCEGFEHIDTLLAAKGVPKGARNHVTDAAAVGIMACETPVAKMLRGMP